MTSFNTPNYCPGEERYGESLLNHSWNDAHGEATILDSGAVLNISDWVNRRECAIENAESLFVKQEKIGEFIFHRKQ